MQLKINRYSVFYGLYIYFLIMITFFPRYINPVFGGGSAIFAVSIIILFYLLPIIFLIIVILDLINKRFKIVLKNVLRVIILFLFTWFLKKQVLDVYVYPKPDTSKEIPASPPME